MLFIATSQVTLPQSNSPALPHASDVKLHSHSSLPTHPQTYILSSYVRSRTSDKVNLQYISKYNPHLISRFCGVELNLKSTSNMVLS